ncbi:MAG: hypothetical protein ACYTGP_01280 [Planctomycetota bacterium]|jgi:hypothetical protein
MRHVLSILVLLVLGAFLSVLVAWTCVLYLPPPVEGQATKLVDAPWPAPVPDEFSETATIHVSRDFGQTKYTAMGGVRGTVEVSRQHVLRAGLPWRCVYREMHVIESPGHLRFRRAWKAPMRWQEGIEPPTWIARERPLPAMPLPLGLAGNSVVYALVLWVLLLGVIALKRRRLRRRGLCPRCAYPAGGSAVCTECGAAI